MDAIRSRLLGVLLPVLLVRELVSLVFFAELVLVGVVVQFQLAQVSAANSGFRPRDGVIFSTKARAKVWLLLCSHYCTHGRTIC